MSGRIDYYASASEDRMESLTVQKKAMKQFQGQHLMDRSGVIAVSFEVAPHNGFERSPFDVRPGECQRVEQHLLDILEESIPVPDSEMVILVPAKEEAF